MNASLCLSMYLHDSIVHGARIGSSNWSMQSVARNERRTCLAKVRYAHGE